MFDNIGGKIKKLASIVAWIGIICSVIAGMVIMSLSSLAGGLAMVVGLLYGGIGALVSWVGSFSLYGFGQFIENSDKIVRSLEATKNQSRSNPEYIVYSTNEMRAASGPNVMRPAYTPAQNGAQDSHISESNVAHSEKKQASEEVKRAFFDRKDPNTRVICPHCNVVQKGDNDHCTCCGATFIYRQMS